MKGQNAPKPLIDPTLADIIWAAGFFDGEGCVHCLDSRQRGSFTVIIANTHKESVTFFRDRFGGVFRRKRPGSTKWKECWEWRAAGRVAAGFLLLVLPYLRIKRLVATDALIYFQTLPGKGFQRKVSPVGTELQNLMFRDVRWLNQRGPRKGSDPILAFRDNPNLFGYQHLTEQHLRDALDAIAPWQIPTI